LTKWRITLVVCGLLCGGLFLPQADATNTYLYVSARIARSESPVIGYSHGLITQAAAQTHTASNSLLHIWNCGSGTLAYSLAAETRDGGNWLMVDPGPHSHVADAPFNPHVMRFNASGMAVGVYTGRVVIAAAGALYPQRELSVELTVEPYPLPVEWLLQYYDSVDDAPAYSVKGIPLYMEYIAGTDPTREDSVFALQIGPPTQDKMNLFVDSVVNRLYSIDYTTNLIQGIWHTIITNFPGDGEPLYFENEMDAPGKFYRIRVRLAD